MYFSAILASKTHFNSELHRNH